MSDWRNGATFADAARAIGKPEKTLRGWLDRKQIELSTDTERGTKWRRFTPSDIAALTLMSRLNNFGLPNALAGEFAVNEIASFGIGRDTAPFDLLQAVNDKYMGFSENSSTEHGFGFLRYSSRDEAVWVLDLSDFALVNIKKAIILAFVELQWGREDYPRIEEADAHDAD